ncbi:hypothetical protein GGI25_004427 [Coemansia spiralis]|uniref:DUF7707 domain-containing protein n=2 Tax=Coemansia TaxID=4863 RepID=A0A9W8KVL2_9FUNG|nr:hypothetical protein EDC05_001613 [Coemansia umbellata]KAJ2624278.1 hypothetical protein GGI26_001634 [Coemansia sp. RSA 1358]KAJ2674210.1 hypothetical protein GGI25_004427 [Coemansia spiralis]
MKFIDTSVAAFVAVTATMAAGEQVWKITGIDSGERANLCARQIQACENSCGGPDQALMKFCNATTLGWGCGCKNFVPPFDTWNWPVPSRDCSGSLDACNANCNSETNNRNACFVSCSKTHKCNTEDAPISYTNTTDVSVTPIYVGPAVSYSGKELGDLNDGNNRNNLNAGGSSASDDSGDSSADESKSDKATHSSTAATGLKYGGATFLAAASAVIAAIAF